MDFANGIIIFAIGHPYYGRYAYNLAISIKAVENFPVALVHDYSSISHLDETQKGVFDILISCDLKPGCGAKLHGYELSPFENTLLLDADMVWLPNKKPSDLFGSLKDVKFTSISEGSTEKPSAHYFFWANIEEIKEVYKIEGVVFQFRTEVMYFKKCEEVQKMFSSAIDIYKEHGLKSVKTFAEGVPDEMAINISAAVHNIRPHDENWKPSYWAQLHQNQIPPLSQLYREYYLLSAGGNINTQNVKNLYNTIIKAQAPKIGLTHCFPVQSKHNFLENRRKS